MNTSLTHLPEHKHQQLQEITATIVKAVDPQMVFLFGSHAADRWVEHAYSKFSMNHYTCNLVSKHIEKLVSWSSKDVL